MGRPLVTLRRYSGIWSSACGVPWASNRTAWRGASQAAISGMGRGSKHGAGDCAELAHVLHHPLHIFDRSTGNNAVPEIEDVSGAAAGLGEDLAHAFAEQIFAGEKHDRVKVALHRNRVAKRGPALVQRHPPIQAN